MLVDSSVWIDFFNGAETAQSVRLRDVYRQENLIIPDLVLMEVLQGFRHQRHADDALRLMSRYRFMPIGGHVMAIKAAANYRRLRALGITIRKSVDCLIATWCIVNDRILLHRDRDFEPFIDHLGLKSAMMLN